jgi:hypothetical protein
MSVARSRRLRYDPTVPGTLPLSAAVTGYAAVFASAEVNTARPGRPAPFGELLHAVRSGEPAADHLYGQPFFSWLSGQPEQAARFTRRGLDAVREARLRRRTLSEAQAAWNCSASVEPARATVSALGEMAEVTRSK